MSKSFGLSDLVIMNSTAILASIIASVIGTITKPSIPKQELRAMINDYMKDVARLIDSDIDELHRYISKKDKDK